MCRLLYTNSGRMQDTPTHAGVGKTPLHTAGVGKTPLHTAGVCKTPLLNNDYG